MSSLLVKERSKLAMISSSQTASESMRRSAPFCFVPRRNETVLHLVSSNITGK
jgi:hypothetical protein